ncbi:MAG: peroxiredoxin [Myxococcales bacterium]|jgi:peroxiredoxin (alkyl hydroperoxide reductase subunit C)|nr:peroxiredoxin [Myxococcales bacterium]
MSDSSPSLPRINEPAPPFAATSTHGNIKLSDYRGKWVVLFSHPADFTPVCSTEFAAFARMQAEFDQRNVQLIGVSVDSIYAHIAWVRSIEVLLDVKVGFPVIADLDMKVAHAYGMIHPGASTTATVRCVFVIDPNQNVRAMVYYPLTTGRNIDEILRVVDALQLNAEKGLATPANWKKGDKCIVPAPLTVQDADKRVREGLESKDWYLSYKPG